MLGFGKSKAEELSKEQEEKVNKKFEEFTQKEYSENDVHKVLDNEDEIMGKMDGTVLAEFVEEVRLFFAMLKDFFTHKYTKVPVGTIMAIAGTLLYVLSPIDVIPDFIPVIGLIDDAAVIALCMKFVKNDIDDYKRFKGL